MKKHSNIAQRTPEWLHKKKGVISGTDLKNIMGTPKARMEAYYEKLAERLTVGVELDYENPMDRGVRLESEAIASFEFETGKKVTSLGFAESDKNAFIGYSPDGLIADTDDSEDIEVKCPGGKNHIKVWLTNEVPEEYLWQIVQGFVVNPKLQKRYFVSYNPDIPSHPLHIIEVSRKHLLEDIGKAEIAQEVFLGEIDKKLAELITI